MDPTDLAAWTPVAITTDAGVPAIDWGDLRGIRFTEPFFTQTVERWAGGDPRPLVRTGLDALRALDTAPSLDPAGFIFHLSRCGSTLVSRLLATHPRTLVISEPDPINSLLWNGIGEDACVEILRLLIRALGRRRFGDEQHYVLKLSSWNVRQIALFRSAFPRTPILWVQRSPAEVVASLLADPPGWLVLERSAAPDPAFFYAERLRGMLAAVDDRVRAVDYSDLPDAVWTDIAPFFGLALNEADIVRMREEAQFESKIATRRRFVARPERAILADPIRALLAAEVDPLYAALSRRRQVREDDPCGVRPRGMPSAVASTTTANSPLMR